jgi:hypothetical protein
MPKQPPTENDIAEVIRLLQEAKTEREKAVTKGNLEDLATTVMGGIREVETKLTARIDTVEGHVRVHALAIRAIDERTGGSTSNMINVRASSAPRRMSPMPQAISVEQTAGGGIRIQDGAQFDKLCKRLDDQEKTIAEITEREVAAQERERVAEEGKRIAQIRQGAVQEYADKLEAKNKKERRLYKRLAMGAAVPVLAAVVHLVQAYVQDRVVDKPHHAAGVSSP